MPPVKFDDIPKTASELLGDDYHVSGTQLKTKLKIPVEGLHSLSPYIEQGTKAMGSMVDQATGKTLQAGAKEQSGVLSSQTDVAFSGKDATPTKLTLKLPRALGLAGVSVDKLEMDKAGKYKLESSMDEGFHGIKGLKMEFKSDLQPAGARSGVFHYALNQVLLKLEAKSTQVKDMTAEATYAASPKMTVGAKLTTTSVDVGARISPSNQLFCSLLAKDKFTSFVLHGLYKVTDGVKVAGTYEMGKKNNGNFTFGVGYHVIQGLGLKAKVQQDMTLSASAKMSVPPKAPKSGVNLIVGGKYNIKDKSTSYGVQLSIDA